MDYTLANTDAGYYWSHWGEFNADDADSMPAPPPKPFIPRPFENCTEAAAPGSCKHCADAEGVI